MAERAEEGEPIVEDRIQEGDDNESREIEEDPGMAADHKELARDMFEKITDYLNGELAGGRDFTCTRLGRHFPVLAIKFKFTAHLLRHFFPDLLSF